MIWALTALMCFAPTVVSCKKENLVDQKKPIANESTTESIVGGIKMKDGCLVFESTQHMEKTIMKLFTQNPDQRTVLYDSLGFEAMSEVYHKAKTECSNFVSYDQYMLARAIRKCVVI